MSNKIPVPNLRAILQDAPHYAAICRLVSDYKSPDGNVSLPAGYEVWLEDRNNVFVVESGRRIFLPASQVEFVEYRLVPAFADPTKVLHNAR
jgi:hypothetical protein